MSVPLELLNGVGAHALPVLAGTAVAAAEVGSSILAKVWEWWTKKTREAERRAELEQLASMTGQQVKDAVREIADKLAGDQPAAVRSKLEGYLLAVPAQVRRTLRRPSDSTGLTVPPDLLLNRPEHLAPLLPPRPPRFAPGERVSGTDFELVELLGIGGFGEVWKAKNAFMPGAPLVALKFCLDPDSAASLRRETSLLDRIQREGKHPGIVELRHTFLSAEPPFLEYELVEGGDLGGLILDWHRTKGGPTAGQAARVLRRLADIVSFAHARGIVHRDLKPANILLAGNQLKVADFGIGGIASEAAARQARLTFAASTLTAAAAHGSYSLYYASPEQMRGASPDPRDDVHALGVIWYQLLVGDLTAEAPRGAGWKKRLAAKGMPADLLDLLESCVASEREDRPADAKEIADRLGFALAEPDGGIDISLDLTAPAELKHTAPPPVVPPPASAAHVRPVAVPLEPERGLDLSQIVPSPHLAAARLHGFVDRLRDIRLLHDRARWAGGYLCWLVPFALCAGLGVAAGAGTIDELDSQSHQANAGLGRDIAARLSTVEIPIEFTGSTHYPVFQLRQSQRRSGKQPLVQQTTRYSYYSSRGAATFYGVDPYPNSMPDAEGYANDVNRLLSQAAKEYNSVRGGKNGLWYAWAVGFPVGVAALVVFVVLRRRKVKNLRAEIPTLIAQTEAEYPRELRTLPEPLNLNSRSAVHNLVTGFEKSGQAPGWMLPTPAHLFHRVVAPF